MFSALYMDVEDFFGGLVRRMGCGDGRIGEYREEGGRVRGEGGRGMDLTMEGGCGGKGGVDRW